MHNYVKKLSEHSFFLQRNYCIDNRKYDELKNLDIILMFKHLDLFSTAVNFNVNNIKQTW